MADGDTPSLPLCAEWWKVYTWYEARSAVAHGETSDISDDFAQRAQWWTTTWLVTPILDWLREHSADPIGALDAAIASLS